MQDTPTPDTAAMAAPADSLAEFEDALRAHGLSTDDVWKRAAYLTMFRAGRAATAQAQPAAWFVQRVAPGRRDHGMRLGPWWRLQDAEDWVDDRHELHPLYAGSPPAVGAEPLSPDALADKCEAWLQSGIGQSNVVDAFEAGYRECERATLSAAPAKPGWVMAPVEPTPEMKIAGDNAGFWCADKYRAMLAAAPQQQDAAPTPAGGLTP